MKIESSSTDYDGLKDLCRRAAKILITNDTRRRYPNGHDAIGADAVEPALPSTRAEATPNILLVAPFEGDSDLVAVAIYVGIGFIKVSDVNGLDHAYETSVLDGNGVEVRAAYIDAAMRLYFSDVRFLEKAYDV